MSLHLDHAAHPPPSPDERQAHFDALYQEWYWPLVRYCSAWVRGTGDGEALAQESFTRAWLSFDRYVPGRAFWPWLVTIAKRVCIDHCRTYRVQSHAAQAEATRIALLVAEPEELLEIAEDHAQVRRAFGRLKQRDRELLSLQVVDGWTYEELADFRGVSIESVRGSLKRARSALRARYEEVAGGAFGALGVGWSARVRGWMARTSNRVNLAMRGVPASLAQMGDVLTGAVATSIAAVALVAAPPAVGHTAPPETTAQVPHHAQPVSSPQAANAHEHEHDGVPADVPAKGTPPARFGQAAPLPGPEAPLVAHPLDRVASPEDTTVSHFAVSPDYDNDGTVFASGDGGCFTLKCPVLFRSNDGGTSWQRLPAKNFEGGRLLLSPRFAEDGRIFVQGPVVQLSEDGGNSFRTLFPVGAPAVLSPAFGDGDERVFVGIGPGWEHNLDTGTTRPLTVMGPLANMPARFNIEFSKAFRKDRTIYVGGAIGRVDGRGFLHRCVDGTCTTSGALPGLSSSSTLLVAGTETSNVILAWTPDSWATLAASRDGGATFEEITSPATGSVESVFEAPDGSIIMLAKRDVTRFNDSYLFRSIDQGRSWTPMTEGAMPGWVRAAAVLPDGTLLSAPTGYDGGGIHCTTDGGASWQRRCRRS